MIFSCEGALQSLSGSNISSVASVIEVPSTPTVMTSATFWKSSECQPDVLPAASQSRRALWEKTLCAALFLVATCCCVWSLLCGNSWPQTSRVLPHQTGKVISSPSCFVHRDSVMLKQTVVWYIIVALRFSSLRSRDQDEQLHTKSRLVVWMLTQKISISCETEDNKPACLQSC